MRIGFYPGCSLEGSSKEYSDSLFAVAEKCGIMLEEIKDWSCCGASAAHNLNHDLALALPARTLALAEKQGFEEVVIPCAACYSRIAGTKQEISNNVATRKKIERYIDLTLEADIKILTVFEFLQKYIFPVADGHIVNKLNQKTACYYGCLYSRPKETAALEQIENPMEMDKVMVKAGATPIDWAFKTECCGAGFTMSRTDIVAKLSGKIIEDAADRGAESIIVACPMCHVNLDMRRPEIKKQLNKEINLPVLFITQALGLSMGIPADQLGLNKHYVPTDKVVTCIVKKEA
ncbi:MAG: CoB--CoM heterodisulfide reductase iron-sulfur subunit B family protein [Bacteroidota bacterium]|nr:CoB--CoM heterodisulfide reductase iron-sulfur subunit B family protein [Bacteroidota bacterium]